MAYWAEKSSIQHLHKRLHHPCLEMKGLYLLMEWVKMMPLNLGGKFPPYRECVLGVPEKQPSRILHVRIFPKYLSPTSESKVALPLEKCTLDFQGSGNINHA
ncbi:hypothetical protein Peur_050684 [Populus x canadensis]